MYIIGITGASGAILGVRLIEELLGAGRPVGTVVSVAAWGIIDYEIGGDEARPRSLSRLIARRRPGLDLSLLSEYANDDLFAPPASGSFRFDAMVIAPCSMKTLSAVASGYADSLISRAADVALKERRRLVLVPRETPLGRVHIENMLRARDAGADIVPPIPGFYTRPRTIDDVVDFTVGKVLNLLGIRHDLFPEWGGGEGGIG
ncbi:MAG TPA: UbiX family flavin prenyltransferase [Spirochaetota bacterium]|nr:UbiX family flavin prenyltransferase [Spirochaetota bacterium]